MSENIYPEDENLQDAIARGSRREAWIQAVTNGIPDIDDLLADKGLYGQRAQEARQAWGGLVSTGESNCGYRPVAWIQDQKYVKRGICRNAKQGPGVFTAMNTLQTKTAGEEAQELAELRVRLEAIKARVEATKALQTAFAAMRDPPQ